MRWRAMQTASMLIVAIAAILAADGLADAAQPASSLAINQEEGQAIATVSPDPETACYGFSLLTDHEGARIAAHLFWCAEEQIMSPTAMDVAVINQPGERVGPVLCGSDQADKVLTCSWDTYILVNDKETVFTQHIELHQDGSWALVESPSSPPLVPVSWPWS